MARPPARQPAGFTLVELLVVVGIIAVLLAILMPSLARARSSARAVTCLSNVRQLSQAYDAYRRANDGHTWAYRPASYGEFWLSLLRPFHAGVDQIRLCPETPDTKRATPGYGSSSSTWGPYTDWNRESIRDHYGSYGFNGWLYEGNDPANFSLMFHTGGRDPYVGRKSIDVALVPTFGDCIWVDAWPQHDNAGDRVPPDPHSGDGGVGAPPTENMTGRFCIDRHRRAVNIAFLDGHAERVELPRLWKLRWSTKFKDKDVTLPW